MNAWKKIALACMSLLILGLAPVEATLAQVRVTAATPSTAYQGTISLDVVVNGSGFDPSAKVQYFVTGTTNPGHRGAEGHVPELEGTGPSARGRVRP